MKVTIVPNYASDSIVYEHGTVECSYQLGDFFHVKKVADDGTTTIEKYPLNRVKRVIEDYGPEDNKLGMINP